MPQTSPHMSLSTVFGGAIPEGTRGVLIERILATPGKRGGHRERVGYVSVDQAEARPPALRSGRYRFACIGPRGVLRGGTRVIEVDENGLVRLARARTPRDYARSGGSRRKARLRAKLRATRTRLRETMHTKHGVQRKVKRRDAQIVREREAHAEEVASLRAELRSAQRATRAAEQARDAAFAYAESQEAARQLADAVAASEGRARVEAIEDVARLETELQALQARHARRKKRRESPRATEGRPEVEGERPSIDAPPPADLANEPLGARIGEEEARLRHELLESERALAAARCAATALEGTARSMAAQRDAAYAEVARQRAFTRRLLMAAGGATALWVVLRWSDSLLGLRPATREDARQCERRGDPAGVGGDHSDGGEGDGAVRRAARDGAHWQGPSTLQARGGASAGAPPT
jgi:hypothetical protein